MPEPEKPEPTESGTKSGNAERRALDRPVLARPPTREADFAAIREKVFKQFSKTLAHLAKTDR